MNADTHAIRTQVALASAQRAFDDMPEPDDGESVCAIREAIRLCDHYTGRAERALQAGDIDAACDLLGSAMRELAEVATMEAS